MRLLCEAADARIEDQSEEEAAVLIAEAVLPASHLSAGDTMSLTTPTMQGLKAPWESRVSWRLRRSRERMMKDWSLVLGSLPEQVLVSIARTVRGKCPVTAPDWVRSLRNISSWGDTWVQQGELNRYSPSREGRAAR